MKKRPFRLEQLLAQRQRHEDAKKLELAESERRHRENAERLARLRRDEERTMRLFAGQRGGRLRAADLQHAETFLAQLAHQIGDQDSLVQQLAEDVTRSRDELAEALKARKALERLKEKDLQEQAQEEKLAEGRAIDELVMARFARRDL